jgi:hypothetical protein
MATNNARIHQLFDLNSFAKELCEELNLQIGTSIGTVIQNFASKKQRVMRHKNVTPESAESADQSSLYKVWVDAFDPFLIERNSNMTSWTLKK